MKILFCTFSIGIIGGIERVTIVKANALADIPGNDVHICYTYRGGYPDKMVHPLSDKVHVHTVGDIFEDINKFNFFYKQLQLRQRIKALIEEINPDVVITTGKSEKHALATIKTKAVKIREYHTASNVCRMSPDGVSFCDKLAKWYENKIESLFFDKVYLLTKENKETRFKNNNRFDYQHNPCPFPIQDDLPQLDRENVVVAVGRFVKVKNFPAIIRIWANVKHEGWKLRLIGDGEERAHIEALIRDFGLEDSVELFGYRNDVPQQLDKCKILAATSLFEGFHLGIIEAMSRGVVPISYRTPYGPTDIITDGVNGVLVDYLNEEEFASKLASLMHSTKLKDMSSAAHKRSKDFLVEDIVDEWMRKYTKLIDKKHKRGKKY